MSGQDLQSWLKANKLTQILDGLNENGIDTLEDIRDTLETVEDINELCREMKLKIVYKKKFIKAVIKLNNITTTQGKPSQVVTSQPGAKSHYHDVEEQKQTEGALPQKPKRKRYNLKGVHPVQKLRRRTVGKRHRTIMVIGATGTGKTTLLNSMMNYLWNVEYADPYRFKLVYETLKKHGQAESVTDDVTAYHLAPPALEYELTVIDTPGFGDTRGLTQDQKITKKIKKFFEQKIQEIDAICFVIRAPQARLTATQKYIFAQVLSIFGNDIADNILILMTFADGKKPPALAALKAGNVPFKSSFKLNNSAFDLPEDDEEDMFTQMFWKMGIASFDKLFKAIDKLKTKSLQLTKKVLSRREELENYIESVQPTIRNGFTVLDKLRQQIIVIQKYGDLINANKNFTYKVNVNKARQIPNGGAFNTTTCLKCRYTCHRNCVFSDNADKERCSAMDRSTGKCRCCPQRCHWSMHKNTPYTVEWYSEQETRTTQELKSKYYDASSKKSIEEQVMAGSVGELAKVEQDLNGLMNNVRNCLNELGKIALRPNVLSQDDYIDKLIQSEEAERKPGYQQRIGALRELKKKQEMLSKLNNDKYDPWAQYKDVQQFIGQNQNVKRKVNRNGNRNNNKRGSTGGSGWFSGWF